jgi:hypothetical protein
MLVAAGDGPPAIRHCRQIDRQLAIEQRPIDRDPAIGAQPRHAAIGIDVEPQMGPGARVGHGHEMVRVALEAGGRHDLAPFRALARHAVEPARFDRGGRREIAGEMTGVNIEPDDRARQAELHHAVIVALGALAARFPAIHPLAVLVILAGNKDGRLGIQHPLLGREEIVGGEDRLRPQPPIGEIDQIAAERMLRLFHHDVTP